jgi:hypothetical protein
MAEAFGKLPTQSVVDTSGTFAETDAQVDLIVESLQDRKATAFAEFWA